MRKLVTLREALTDPALLGHAIPGETWLPWRVLLIAAMGEALTDEERPLFMAMTARDREPLHQVEELWAIVGRRGGKTRAAGTLAAYIGCLCDHGSILAPGERATIPVMAANISQAGKAFNHALGVLEHSPDLAVMIERSNADTIQLASRVDIEVRPAHWKTVRGSTAVAAIADEVAFWSLDGSRNPDGEILAAVRPSLATTGGPLICITSPYAKRGEAYSAFSRDYGPKGDPLVLVAQGASRIFNPSLSQRVVDRAYARDPVSAAAEYGGLFRGDVQAFISREAVQAVVAVGVLERPRRPGVEYRAFVDPSGGANDSFTLAIGHQEGDSAVLDVLRERKAPFQPEAVVRELCEVVKAYGIRSVTGDRYAGEWPPEQFRKCGVEYLPAELSKSELYRSMLPRVNSRQVSLLDDRRLVEQIAGLERRVARGGREVIDHPPNGHDDVANAAAGVISLCARPTFTTKIQPLRI